MFKKTLAAGLVALATSAFAAPANAGSVGFSFSFGVAPQVGFYYGHYGLSPSQIQRALARHGFTRVSFVDRTAYVYRVSATDYRGHRVRLVVSARDGRILQWERVRRA